MGPGPSGLAVGLWPWPQGSLPAASISQVQFVNFQLLAQMDTESFVRPTGAKIEDRGRGVCRGEGLRGSTSPLVAEKTVPNQYTVFALLGPRGQQPREIFMDVEAGGGEGSRDAPHSFLHIRLLLWQLPRTGPHGFRTWEPSVMS